MTEYDQERLSELAEELDRAKEKIRCLEAEIRDLKRKADKQWVCDVYAALLRAHSLDQIKAAIKSVELELTK